MIERNIGDILKIGTFVIFMKEGEEKERGRGAGGGERKRERRKERGEEGRGQGEGRGREKEGRKEERKGRRIEGKEKTYHNTLSIHITVTIRFSPKETSISFLSHKKVRKIYFLKSKINGTNEKGSDIGSSFTTKSHSFLHRIRTKADHDRVSITINHHRIEFISIGDGVFLLHQGFSFVNHISSIRCDRGGDGNALKLSFHCSCKSIY